MSQQQQIFAIANQLANAGQTPSVALIKAKLTTPAPLPVIISALKLWQHEPEFTQVPSQTSTTDQQDEQQTIINDEHIKHLIAEAIKPLQAEISQLKAQLARLDLE